MDKDLRIKIKVDSNTGELIVTQKEFSKLGKAVDTTTNSFTSFIDKAKTVVGVSAAYLAFQQTIGKLVTTGIEFNKQTETMRIGISSLIAVNSSNETSLGRTVDASEKYRLATIASKEAIESLKIANKETSATLPELTQAFQSALAPATKAGLSIKETVEYTKLMTQAAGAMGIPMNQLAQEIKSVISGTIDMNSVVGTNLGLTNEQIKTATEQGKLYDFLVSKLDDFATAGTDVSASFEGSMSNMQDALMELAGELTKPIFETLKEESIDLTTWFQKMTDKVREFKVELTNIKELNNLESMNAKMISLAKTWEEYETKKNAAWYSWDWLPQDAILKQQRDIEGEMSLLAERMNYLPTEKKETLVKKIETNTDAQNEIVDEYEKEFETKNINKDKEKTKNKSSQSTKQRIETKSEPKEKINTEPYDEHVKSYEDFMDKKSKITENFNDDYNRSLMTQTEYELSELTNQRDFYNEYVDDKLALDKWYDAEKKQIMDNRTSSEKTAVEGIKDSFKEYVKESQDTYTQVNHLFTNGLYGMEDALVDFITTGKASFSDFINSIAADFVRMMVKMNITSPLASAASSVNWGSMLSSFAFANGGIMSSQGAVPLRAYSSGGIVNSPQLALYGEGRMNEAYVPLPDGKTIPVTMSGSSSGATTLILNIENNSGQAIDAKQISQMTSTDSEGRKTEVLSIVIDAYNRNLMQLRDTLKGGR